MSTDPDLLARAAARATQHEPYLASAFAVWLEAHPRTDLAEHLGLGGEQLPSLALCRRPARRADVEMIARRFGCDPDRLADLAGV